VKSGGNLEVRRLEKLSDPSSGHSSNLKRDATHYCKTSVTFTRKNGVIFPPYCSAIALRS
jgi:hypothetical protein